MPIVEIGTVNVRMRPVGFALYAEEFLIAADSIPATSRARGNTTFSPVPYYLLCRSLELALKAYLTERHVSEGKLKKRYGHNLEALWRACLRREVTEVVGPMNPEFGADLRDANVYYKAKVFEYFDFRRWAENYDQLPHFGRFADETRRIVTMIRADCFSKA